MKIALIGRYGESEIVTGPEKVARHLFDQIAILNPDTKFITYFFKHTKKRQLKKLLFGSEKVSTNQNIRRLGIFKLVITLLHERPDIVHIVTFERFELFVLFLKSLLKYKLVYTIHGIYRYERKIFYKKPSLLSDLKDLLLEKLLFAKSDLLIFLSPQMFRLGQSFYKLYEKKVSIIPNGVSLPEYTESKSFKFSAGIEIVFYNGINDSRQRGLEDLINVLSDTKMNNLKLSVLGIPKKTEHDWIKFFNPLPEKLLFKFLSDKHIFIDNLGYMPFSIIALEAMSLGLIIIVSSESGIAQYIKSGENGFLYDVNKTEEIGTIVHDIATGKFSPDVLSKNAKLTVKELSWHKIADHYFKIYQDLVK